MEFDVRGYNRGAWDRAVGSGDMWTVPVGADVVEKARGGEWEIVLTPKKAVPREWFGELKGAKVLGLAAGGGQQGPILAAAGATVVVFDNSPGQLAQDRLVAERDGLAIETVEGDMADLGCFGDGSFDLVFHPCSNCFVPDVLPVWRECFRVLKPGGVLLAGFVNPVEYALDKETMWDGRLTIKNRIPYSDLEAREGEMLEALQGDPMEFGHTLQDQIGGQIDAGFVLIGFYEDKWDIEYSPISHYMNSFMATRALKPTV